MLQSRRDLTSCRHRNVCLSTFSGSGLNPGGGGLNPGGDGFYDTVKDIYNRGSQIGNYLSDLYGSQIGTIAKNIIPSSDDTGRNAFQGEKHAILQLPNGKFGIANYMGPGTNVVRRLQRNDPGRTNSDTVAKRHDIDYALAQGASSKNQQIKLIREADNRMINSLNRIERNRSDDPKNIFIGKRLIQAKTALEDLGGMKEGSFGGDLKNISRDDRIILETNRDRLIQEGYGYGLTNNPSDELKMKLLKSYKQTKKQKLMGRGKGRGKVDTVGIKKVCNKCAMRGDGLGSMFKSVIKFLGPVAKELGPTVLKEIVLPIAKQAIANKLAGKGASRKKLAGKGLKLAGQRGKGLKLAGQRGKGIDNINDLVKTLVPKLSKMLGINPDNVDVSKILGLMNKAGVLKTVLSGDTLKTVNQLEKIMLPYLITGNFNYLKKLKGGSINPKINMIKFIKQAQKRLRTPFKKAMLQTLKNNQSGKGLGIGGNGFWSDFKRGFTSVFKPAAKIIAPIATALGQPEIGIPLGIVGNML